MKSQNQILKVVAHFPMKHEVELTDETGKIYYWKLPAIAKLSRYPIGARFQVDGVLVHKIEEGI